MTSISRPTFGSGMIAALSTSLLRPTALKAQTAPELVARQAKIQLAPETYPETEVWGDNGSVSGPAIRLPQGAHVSRRFANELARPGKIHGHGTCIDNAMDGVPGLTQDVIQPGGPFLYDFVVPDAGKYWYHPHNRSWEQMARGLCGALVVGEANGAPEVDSDEVMLIDDWRLGEDAQMAFVADDPGDWMLHCPMFAHSAAGMMTLLRVG